MFFTPVDLFMHGAFSRAETVTSPILWNMNRIVFLNRKVLTSVKLIVLKPFRNVGIYMHRLDIRLMGRSKYESKSIYWSQILSGLLWKQVVNTSLALSFVERPLPWSWCMAPGRWLAGNVCDNVWSCWTCVYQFSRLALWLTSRVPNAKLSVRWMSGV